MMWVRQTPKNVSHAEERKENYSIKEENMTQKTYGHLKEENQGNREQVEELKDDVKDYKKEVKRLEAELEDSKKQLADSQKQLADVIESHRRKGLNE